MARSGSGTLPSNTYLIRFDGEMPGEQMQVVLRTIPLVIIIQLPFFLLMGVYRGLWRYTGISDLMTIAWSVLAGTVFSTMTVMLIYNFKGPSRGASILYGMLLLLLIAASRLSFRLIPALIGSRTVFRPDARPVLIYGASDSSEILIREILSNPDHGYRPVGFVDEDTRMAGKVIHGYRIFDVEEMPAVIREHGINEVLIPSLRVSDRLLDNLRTLGVSPRRMNIRFE